MAPKFVERWRARNYTPARRAAVAQLNTMRTKSYRRLRRPEQERASFFARKLGLTRFAAGLLADSASRCHIRVEHQKTPGDPQSWEPASEQLFTELLERYSNDIEDRRELLRQRVWHDQTTGECLQVTERSPNGVPQFKIRSALLADFSGSRVLVRDMRGGMPSDGSARWYEPEQVRRYWFPDEEEPRLATSPLIGVLEDVERYWALHRATRHRAESAIAMNGLFWYPNEADTSLPLSSRTPGGVNSPGTRIESDYYDLAQLSLDDDDEVAAYVPLPVHWPAQYGPPQFVPFDNALDPNGLQYRQEAVADIARGLNYPQRLLVTGVGEGNHWSDWLLQPEFVRSTLAPVLERVIWGDLTRGFVRPALNALYHRGLFHDDPQRYRAGFDTAPVIVRPDQSARSVELYRLGIVGADTVLRTNGFDKSDMATPEEVKRYIEIMQAIGKSQGTPAPPGGNAGSPGASSTTGIDAGSVREAPPLAAAVASVRPFAAELVGWLED